MTSNPIKQSPEDTGLVSRQRLTGAEISEIRELTETCNAYEGLKLRLSLEMLRSRDGNAANDFLYYQDGKPVGYFAIDNFGFKEKEALGMVHPDYRRRGIFRSLLAAAIEECRHRGVQKLILVCEHSSQSGQAFVKAVGAHYDFSEHEMVLGTFQERESFDERLRFRQARAGDFDLILSILATDLEKDEDTENLKQGITKLLQRPNIHFYLGILGEEHLSCEEPIGCLRLDEMENEVGIYGFVVRPDYRGRGYGRQILEEAIRTIRTPVENRSIAPKEIMLEVDITNTNAIGLYRSCGFEITTTYDYYALDIQ